jgi:surfactin synthase thioesterase subunit
MLTAARPSPWIVTHRPSSSGLRLICFPYAGAGASVFRSWGEGLPPDVEICAVQLPGRESRITECPVGDLRELLPKLDEALEPYLDRPFAFFGHSIGALVSFELARELRRTRRVEPLHLFVSGCSAPHHPDSDRLSELPESEFVDRLKQFNGTPPEVLHHPELMQLVLPTLRADFSLRDRYLHRDEPPLDCPITAFGGMADSHVSGAKLEGWKQHTRERFQLWLFQGDHFFLRTAQEPMLEALSSLVSRYRGASQ